MKKFSKVVALVAAMMLLAGFASAYEAEFGAQFDTTVDADVYGEWPSFADAKVTFDEGEEATFTYEFSVPVKFAGNYVAVNTDYPYTEDVVASIKSVKVDGNEVAFNGTYLNDEGTNGGLRLTLTNLWNTDITDQPMDASAVPEFQKLEITFVVGESAAAADDTSADDTTADDTTADDTTNLDSTPSTGDATSIVMLSAVAVLALCGVVVSKKRA